VRDLRAALGLGRHRTGGPRGESKGPGPDPDAARQGRRRVLLSVAGLFMSPALAACGRAPSGEEEGVSIWGREGESGRGHREGRLSSRPGGRAASVRSGLQKLGLGGRRDTLLYVPAAHDGGEPAPLALMLHGAGGDAGHGMSLLESFADRAGIILLAPASAEATWDLISERPGPDVGLVDRALAETFSRCHVDRARLAAGGFSDGASYALSLGLANGDLFTHVLAFSPGFMAPPARRGTPRLFVSHGTEDRVLPIDVCSRRVVPQARAAGYDVTYREFPGPHTVPPEVAADAVAWFTGQPESPRGSV